MTSAGVQRELMKTIRQRQLNFLGHVMRRHGLENLALTGKVGGKRGRGRQRLKYLDSLCTCLKDNKTECNRARSGPQRTCIIYGSETIIFGCDIIHVDRNLFSSSHSSIIS